jgi:hypothetical protein
MPKIQVLLRVGRRSPAQMLANKAARLVQKDPGVPISWQSRALTQCPSENRVWKICSSCCESRAAWRRVHLNASRAWCIANGLNQPRSVMACCLLALRARKSAPKDNIFDRRIAVQFISVGGCAAPKPSAPYQKGEAAHSGWPRRYFLLRGLRCGPLMILESQEAHSR